jgi:hypothetical protein
MHPGDVVEHVAAEVAELERRLEVEPELGVTRVALENETNLYVSFTRRDRPRLTAVRPGSLVGPGGQATSVRIEGIDLSQRIERQLILFLECDGLDGRPPTAQLLTAEGLPLPPAEWPTDLTRQGVVHGHRDYDRPFFCRRGLREFHTHPQHQDQPWDLYREQLPLHAVVLELLRDLRGRWMLR